MASWFTYKWRDAAGLWRDWWSRFTSPPRKPDLRRYPKRKRKPANVRRRVPKPPPIPDLPPLPAEPLPGEMKERWAGQYLKARKVILPEKQISGKPRRLARLKTRGERVIGDVIGRSRLLSTIQHLPAGIRIRITCVGKTKDGPTLRKGERSREFILGETAKKTKIARMDFRAGQLLHHMMAVLGKEFFTARGRGYDILDPSDSLVWTVSIIEEEENADG